MKNAGGRKNTRTFLALATLLVSLPFVGSSQNGDNRVTQKKQLATIGTGGLTGVYYPAGGVISIIVNKKADVYGLELTVQATEGSVFNINEVLAGNMEFGIVQSDRQFQAVNGEAEWSGRGPQQGLMAVCALYPESVTLVAAEDAGILSIENLRGKRVNIGEPGSGNRGNAIDALATAGLNWETDIRAEQLNPNFAFEQTGCVSTR